MSSTAALTSSVVAIALLLRSPLAVECFLLTPPSPAAVVRHSRHYNRAAGYAALPSLASRNDAVDGLFSQRAARRKRDAVAPLRFGPGCRGDAPPSTTPTAASFASLGGGYATTPPLSSSSSSSSSTALSASAAAEGDTERRGAVAAGGPPAVTARDLTCSFDGGETYQLRDASYVLPRGGRVGLVGRNGCGKSTFLRILAEACAPSSTASNAARDNVPYVGEVECPRDVRVAFVEQEPPSPSGVTVSDALLGVVSVDAAASPQSSGGGAYDAVRRYRLAALRASDDPDAFGRAASDMDAAGGWDVLTKADEVATRLRVKHLEDQPLSSLSGGERKRVALAAALVREPDVLILDEPTNHLDLAAIRWLSDLLVEKRGKLTLLTVTHDRAFLEEVCDAILELDRGSFYEFEGSYNVYLSGKEERLANEDQAVRDAKTSYKKELEWMRRQPQGRQTKQKARIDAFYKLEKATKPREADPTLALTEDGKRRLGGNILKMRNASLAFGEKKMLGDFSYDFNNGDRIGIVGRNGVGKSTFIKILAGQQLLDEGAVETGETVVFGMYDQMGIPFFDEEETVLEFMRGRVESGVGTTMAEAPNEAMRLLQQFQFERHRWQERVSMLSGGEKRRLQLLSVITKRPNFLILDEPTNDIDLDTLRALESYLDEFNGVLVIVSHDRSFTDKVTNHLFVFEGDGVVKDYPGSLSDYAECLVEQENAAYGSTSTVVAVDVDKNTAFKEEKEKKKKRRNALNRMKREIDKLEPAIEKLNDKAAVLQKELDESADEGWTVLADLTAKMQTIADEVDEKELRWLELAEDVSALEEQD